MKRKLIMGILMLGVLCFAACEKESSVDSAVQAEVQEVGQEETQAVEQEVQEKGADKTSYEDDMVMVWQDVTLETIVRTQLQKPEGDITYADVKLITYLDLEGEKVRNINDLKYFTNLEYLDISTTPIADVSVLSELDNLKEFVSLNRYVDDYSALNDIDDIRTVFVGSLGVFDFDCLRNIDSLEELGIVGVIEDTDKLVKVLDRNPNMKSLHLRDNQLDNFSFLKKCKYKENYEVLDLSSYTISGESAELDVNDLIGYSNLRELDILKSEIKNATSLAQFDTVYEMRISGSPIDKETVSAILEMENLSILFLTGCEIEDETPLYNTDKWFELCIT